MKDTYVWNLNMSAEEYIKMLHPNLTDEQLKKLMPRLEALADDLLKELEKIEEQEKSPC